MNKKLYLLLFFPLLFSFIRQQEDLILWNAKRPLRYEDFKVVQKDTIKIANSGGRFKGAQSQLKFRFNTSQSSYTTTPKIEVSVYFLPNESWMLIKSETTLEHEQIHFNIAELFARKMRKSIDSLVKMNTYDFQAYKQIIANWNEKYGNYNVLYDKGIDDRVYYLNGKFLSDKNPKQKPWKEKVDKELKALDKYKLN